MLIDPWLPQGFSIAGVVLQRCSVAADSWQVFDTRSGGAALVVGRNLADKWIEAKLLSPEQICSFTFGQQGYAVLVGGRDYRLEPVDGAQPPSNLSECEAFVSAVSETRKIWADIGLHDALYVERLSRLLPCFSPAPTTDDATIVGAWITGGVRVSLSSTRRMQALAPWISKTSLQKLLAGISGESLGEGPSTPPGGKDRTGIDSSDRMPSAMFALPGRPELEQFFNEHVVDLVLNEDRYKALGIAFPGAVLLHGPPGCGKTFAVEKLVEFLDWPSFAVDSGSIGSPYIHETGRKIAEVFDKAASAAPAVVVIDEVDAFLASRDASASGQHRVEEVAEFLRAIPNAAKGKVLVIGMTNRLDSLDPAVVRRGRFDHIISVGMPTEAEVTALLTAMLGEIPHSPDIEIHPLAVSLAGRPLSDVGFVLRESCRLAARAGCNRVGSSHIADALRSTPSRVEPERKARKIGFV